MIVIPNFVPESALALVPDARMHSRPYFLFVGRLEKLKGVETLLPVFDRYPDADLLIAGAGKYGGELRRRTKDIKNVHFLGAVPHEQLGSLYRKAIALLLPSAGYEVFPLVILEAHQQGTPVIAHHVGGLPEIIEQSGGGFLYQTPEDMLVAMEQLQTDPDLRQKLGEQGYQAYRRNWSEEAHLNAYFRVLEETALQKLGVVPWNETVRTSLQFPDSAGHIAPSAAKAHHRFE